MCMRRSNNKEVIIIGDDYKAWQEVQAANKFCNCPLSKKLQT